MIGDKFGKWTVISDVVKADNRYRKYYFCRCECGREKFVYAYYLKNSKSTACVSCGISLGKTRHGKCNSRVYASWAHMKARCENKNNKDYPYYGGRGIKFCDRWRNFDNFIEDMGEPLPAMTLDRIDSNKDYTKDNCRWASRGTQSRNTRACINLSFNGQTKTLSEWARSLKINKATLYYKIKKGIAFEQAIQEMGACID